MDPLGICTRTNLHLPHLSMYESLATRPSKPVPTIGASGRNNGAAWSSCMFDPINARLASSCSRNGINEAAIEVIWLGRYPYNRLPARWSGSHLQTCFFTRGVNWIHLYHKPHWPVRWFWLISRPSADKYTTGSAIGYYTVNQYYRLYGVSMNQAIDFGMYAKWWYQANVRSFRSSRWYIT